MTILFFISLLLNVVCVVGIFNLLNKIETYEDFTTELQRQLDYVLQQIRSIDIRGAFEADDEVGLVFKAMKGMIDTLDKFLQNGGNVEKEESKE